MNGLILTVQHDHTGWQVTIWEGCFSIYQAVGLASPITALETGQAWLRTHRPGVACLVEVAGVQG